MPKEIVNAIERFKELDQRISHFTDISALLDWDANTGAPKKGVPMFSKAKGTLSAEIFKLLTSEEMGDCLEVLTSAEGQAELDDITRAAVRYRKREYDNFKKVPAELHKELVIHASNAHTVWVEAKQTNNFAHFEPTLAKMVDLQRRLIECYGYEGHPYDALLDGYEPGLTVAKLDPLFKDLRDKTVQLLKRLMNSKDRPSNKVLFEEYDVEKQKEFNLFILPKLGYDLSAGRLDISEHPFAQSINTGDVRITTRYKKNDLRSSLFGTIHECGHALYEQGINPAFEETAIRRGTSFGIHESQSRFLENMVGRSYPFWTYFYDDLQRHFPRLKSLPLEDFYRAINTVEPSFIRVEADELTYNLHIMVRYEIEKALMNGEIEVKELPRIWNEKMEEYLGIVPPTDTLGVLQDVHWSFGGFGYFPSYSLGNLYAAQILNTIEREIPDFYTLIANGEFAVIREWLRENIHQHGAMYTPDELIVKVTGEELNAEYLVKYLEEKYSKIYRL